MVSPSAVVADDESMPSPLPSQVCSMNSVEDIGATKGSSSSADV
eukprot:CAMPEP_0181396996 /NCGR_PEP_ID=MMETSP1110-20121109/228_1 /TAXON_ID=174948 /ORGANISM="Symbiodinium sp., Strain CCMP421" /LENGTH=43 /DNA_ID= /DNA_START= /DNA_END= /DNA_ORIENTATION=